MTAANIIHHGGKVGVTGSCHELKLSPSASILVDCGLTQGAETSADGGGSSSCSFKFPITPIKAVILTHVHIDHCGRLPYLLGAGYKGPIFCSEASAQLLPLVLEDAVKIGITRDKDLLRQFTAVLKKRLVPLPYSQWQELGTLDGVTVRMRLQQSGHIMGSSIVELDVRQVQRSRFNVQGSDPANLKASPTRIVFSGDLGAPDTPLLPDPVIPERADILLLESTYGDRLHEDRNGRVERLRKIIIRALKNRGAILVPAFSIGRTQELLYELEGLIASFRDEEATAGLPWDDLEVVVDSPMAQQVTEIYSELQALWDAEAKEVVSNGRHPLSFEQMTVISSHDEHLQTVTYLKKSARPCIVIAAGGMCAGGRIVNYLKALLKDHRTDVIFIGYQAEGTPGREIQQQGTGGVVNLDGINCPIRAQIHTITGYSAHADQQNLVDFVRAMPEKPRLIKLVHGEPAARRSLAEKLRVIGIMVEE
ncbi:MAG: MBL fold hydrolase [Nitrospirae bacterium GWC2_56_14]|nr:MAG: MBL fold hydrolase [Nitrospirae bacterium GWC2_56_14]